MFAPLSAMSVEQRTRLNNAVDTVISTSARKTREHETKLKEIKAKLAGLDSRSENTLERFLSS